MLAKMGAFVTLTDLPECLDKIKENVKANEVENDVSILALPW